METNAEFKVISTIVLDNNTVFFSGSGIMHVPFNELKHCFYYLKTWDCEADLKVNLLKLERYREQE